MNIHFKDINMRIKKAHMEDTVLALLKQENISKEEYDNDFGIKNKIADIGLDIFSKKCNANYDELSDNEYIDLCIWILSQFCTRDRVKDIILSWQSKIDNNQIDSEFGNIIIYLAILQYSLNKFYFNNDIELLRQRYNNKCLYTQTIIDELIKNKDIIATISIDNMKFFINVFSKRLNTLNNDNIICYNDMPMSIFNIVNIYYCANKQCQDEIKNLYIILYQFLQRLNTKNFIRIYLNMLPIMKYPEFISKEMKQYMDNRYDKEKLI